jgi:hypothetical protein
MAEQAARHRRDRVVDDDPDRPGRADLEGRAAAGRAAQPDVAAERIRPGHEPGHAAERRPPIGGPTVEACPRAGRGDLRQAFRFEAQLLDQPVVPRARPPVEQPGPRRLGDVDRPVAGELGEQQVRGARERPRSIARRGP